MKELIEIECTVFGHYEKQIPSKIGVSIISDESQISLFSIDHEENMRFLNNIPSICDQVVNVLYESKSVLDFSWTYTASSATSRLTFLEENQTPVSLIIENGWVIESYCHSMDSSEYKEAIVDPRGLEASLRDGLPEHIKYVSPPVKIHIAQTPLRNQKLYALQTPYKNIDPDEYPVINVDAKRFLDYWRKQSRPDFFLKFPSLYKVLKKFGWPSYHLDESDHKLLQSTQKVSNNYVIPSEMACGVALDFDKKIRFTNGRHRCVNLANAGAPFIPIQIYGYQRDEMINLFQWDQ